MRVAQVIINRPAKQLHKPLSYLMPEKFGNVLTWYARTHSFRT